MSALGSTNSRNMSMQNKAFTTGGGFNKTFAEGTKMRGMELSANRRPELNQILDPSHRANSHA